MIQKNKVLTKLKKKTFDNAKSKKDTFERATVTGTTLDDSVGVLLSANEDASKIVLQVGKQTIMLNPTAFLFVLKSVNLLSSKIALNGPNKFTEALMSDFKQDEESGKMDVFTSIVDEEGNELWDKSVDEEEIAKRTSDEIRKSAPMTQEREKEHAKIAERLLDPEDEDEDEDNLDEDEIESASIKAIEEDMSEKSETSDIMDLMEEEEAAKPTTLAERKAKALNVEGDYEKEEKPKVYVDSEDEEDETWEEGVDDNDEEEESDEEDIEEEQVQDEDFIKRMSELEGALTGEFKVRKDEEPTFEKIQKMKAEHGELAAREYIESLTQEQREELMRARVEEKAKAKNPKSEE